MDAPTDASHVFRFREIHFDRHWQPGEFGNGVAYRLVQEGVGAAVTVVAADDTRIRRTYLAGEVLVFGDMVHLPRQEAEPV
jgi:hypothetical protein